uniref:Glycosyl hydrolase family 57 n=1 Tax=Magnetococcus massalia (strain MO-1) TaxID=451514 RepID=A0A1S7LFC7_MAGMO|nr:Conserved protein of unknown function [Candidatus Magnetococcus massalia]
MIKLQEYVEDMPNISGHEAEIRKQREKTAGQQHYLARSDVDFGSVDSVFCVALHMHQPLIPAGGDNLATNEVISNLQDMWNNQGIGDNHNAPVFKWCYERMGEFVPQLIGEGKSPRVMLEYSGNLLHGMRKMGLNDTFEKLHAITTNDDFNWGVEWLGCPWGHAVAPSTPVLDFRRHVEAWQHHFAAIFGMPALERVRGFSPSEMALPNHPDVAYEYIKTLTDCGYSWVLIQEHSVELPENGHGLQQKHLPHRLVVKNSKGEEASIIALIKTQGSDTKLVAQMQPYYEAKSIGRTTLAGQSVPPIVSQIADGENGGVMMNEFPPKFQEAVRDSSGTNTRLVNGTEYIEYLASIGITEKELPACQPVHQKMIWDRMQPGDGPEKLAKVIEACKQENHQFHMDGGSWTNDLSWVSGYENVLGPMESASSKFHEVITKPGVPSSDPRFRKALFHLMNSQTSCFRYWGQGTWTDYGVELCRRAEAILDHDF